MLGCSHEGPYRDDGASHQSGGRVAGAGLSGNAVISLLSKRCFWCIRNAIHDESWRGCGLKRKGSQDNALRNRDT